MFINVSMPNGSYISIKENEIFYQPPYYPHHQIGSFVIDLQPSYFGAGICALDNNTTVFASPFKFTWTREIENGRQ